MKTINAMQLKALIKNMAREKRIPAQFALQTYMMERLLERISLSRYNGQFILKGGFLISAMIGLDMRVTMDMDATLKGLPLTNEMINEIFNEISTIVIDDGVEFHIKGIEDIRKSDDYLGYRVSLEALYPPIATPLRVDITTGDKITPREVVYDFSLMFEDRTIQMLTYNLETVLAEKLQTIISRGVLSTRPRDYYDVYMLWQLYNKSIDISTLTKALIATNEHRNTLDELHNWQAIVDNIKENDNVKRFWKEYQRTFTYAKEIEFEETCNVIIFVLSEIFSLQK